MSNDVYRYTFDAAIPMHDIKSFLFLARLFAEGEGLDVRFVLDEEMNACVVDATTPAGRSVAELFTGLVIRELGQDAFKVEALGRDARGEARERGTAA